MGGCLGQAAGARGQAAPVSSAHFLPPISLSSLFSLTLAEGLLLCLKLRQLLLAGRLVGVVCNVPAMSSSQREVKSAPDEAASARLFLPGQS